MEKELTKPEIGRRWAELEFARTVAYRDRNATSWIDMLFVPRDALPTPVTIDGRALDTYMEILIEYVNALADFNFWVETGRQPYNLGGRQAFFVAMNLALPRWQAAEAVNSACRRVLNLSSGGWHFVGPGCDVWIAKLADDKAMKQKAVDDANAAMAAFMERYPCNEPEGYAAFLKAAA